MRRLGVLVFSWVILISALPVLAAVLNGKLQEIRPEQRKIAVRLPDGKQRIFTVPADAAVTINDQRATLLQLDAGTEVTITTNDSQQVTAVRVSQPGRKTAPAAPVRAPKPAPAAVTPPTPKETPAAEPAAPRTPAPPAPMEETETVVAAEDPPARGTPRRPTRSGRRPGTPAANADEKKAEIGPWPQFLGPDRNNISREKGLLKSWPADGPELLWTARGMGRGYSSVSVADGHVFTMGNVGEDECVLAVNVENGSIAWKQRIAPASKLSAGDGPRGTPTYDGTALYALGGNGDLACLDPKNGEIRWQKNILKEFNGNNITWGICESVLIDGDKLICTPGGRDATMVALNKTNGEVIWRSLVPNGGSDAGYASAVPVDIGNTRQYIQFTARGTISVRARDGEFLWGNDRSSNGTANCSAPVISGDNVFTASGYGTGGCLLKLTATAATEGFFTRDMKNHHGGMVVVDGFLYGSNDPGTLTCIDLSNGRTKWQDRSVGKGSLTCADGHLVLRSENGPLALVEVNSGEYIEKGQFEQPDRSGANAWAYPVIADGKLYLRDQDLLLCYDVKDSGAAQP